MLEREEKGKREKMMKGRSEMDGVAVPEAVIDTLNSTLESLQQLETHLPQFLSLSDPDSLAELPLLERAHSLFALAKLTSTLFSLKLRCRGVNPNDHPVKFELDKINKLQKKLERLPRFSEEQKQDTRDISEREELEMDYQERTCHKRKYPSSEEQFVQIEGTMGSLAKVKEERAVDNNGHIKEAIIIDISDDDE